MDDFPFSRLVSAQKDLVSFINNFQARLSAWAFDSDALPKIVKIVISVLPVISYIQQCYTENMNPCKMNPSHSTKVELVVYGYVIFMLCTTSERK